MNTLYIYLASVTGFAVGFIAGAIWVVKRLAAPWHKEEGSDEEA